MFTSFDVASQHDWLMLSAAEGRARDCGMKHHLVRLDRIAGELNAWLLAIAIGLGMLDMTVLIAKCLPPLSRPPAAVSADGPAGAGLQSPSPQSPGVRS
jgi:hypothetical protein